MRRTPRVMKNNFSLNYNINISANLFVQVIHVGKVEELKEEVRRDVLASAGHPSQQLSLIDALQRLGVAYHFEREIQEALQYIFATYNGYNELEDDDVYNVALRFRLLRQQGFNASCSETHVSFSTYIPHISWVMCAICHINK